MHICKYLLTTFIILCSLSSMSAESDEERLISALGNLKEQKLELQQLIDALDKKLNDLPKLRAENEAKQKELATEAVNLVEQIENNFPLLPNINVTHQLNFNSISFRGRQPDCKAQMQKKLGRTKAKNKLPLYQYPVPQWLNRDKYQYVCGYFHPIKTSADELGAFYTTLTDKQSQILLRLTELEMILKHYTYLRPHPMASKSAIKSELRNHDFSMRQIDMQIDSINTAINK